MQNYFVIGDDGRMNKAPPPTGRLDKSNRVASSTNLQLESARVDAGIRKQPVMINANCIMVVTGLGEFYGKREVVGKEKAQKRGGGGGRGELRTLHQRIIYTFLRAAERPRVEMCDLK